MIIKAKTNNGEGWHVFDEISHLFHEKTTFGVMLQREVQEPLDIPDGPLRVIEGTAGESGCDGTFKAVYLEFKDYYKVPVRILTNLPVYLCTNYGKTIERIY